MGDGPGPGPDPGPGLGPDPGPGPAAIPAIWIFEIFGTGIGHGPGPAAIPDSWRNLIEMPNGLRKIRIRCIFFPQPENFVNPEYTEYKTNKILVQIVYR